MQGLICRSEIRITNAHTCLMLCLFLVLSGCASRRDTHEHLDGILWMQTSAEYKMLAQQQYRSAQDALDQALDSKDASWSAAVEQTNALEHLPPAVILDIDETVLDNTAFEASLAKERIPFDRQKFRKWVSKADALAVPGAVEFIHHARKRGVAVLFVTNRSEDEESDTRKNLERLGIDLPIDVDPILSNHERPFNWPSDKKDRRRFLAEKYRILLLVGDDLADFVSVESNEPDRRNEIAGQHRDKWGKTWFLIPNPLYGSWELALYPKGLTDTEILAKKRELLRSY